MRAFSVDLTEVVQSSIPYIKAKPVVTGGPPPVLAFSSAYTIPASTSIETAHQLQRTPPAAVRF